MNIVKKIETNGRLFFVSDIHGELPTLLHGLKELGFVEGADTLVCAGDGIDRGRFSLNTITHFLSDKTGSYHTVLGNHDCFAFSGDNDLWVMNGGIWAFQDLLEDERLYLGACLRDLPYVIEVTHKGEKFGVVHAAVPQDFQSWEEFLGVAEIGNPNLLQEVTWEREFVEYSKCKDFQIPLDGVKYTIHGHTVVREPLLVGNRWHIDTGLVYGKHLTIAEVVDGELQFHKFNLV